jgi:hypothetical protein
MLINWAIGYSNNICAAICWVLVEKDDEMFLVEAGDGELEDFEINIAIGQVPSDYEFLGYDVATKSVSAFFECSPLSCNGAAADFGTNRYCLLDGQSQADAALLQMSIVKYEPGLCYLFRVHRQKIMNHG